VFAPTDGPLQIKSVHRRFAFCSIECFHVATGIIEPVSSLGKVRHECCSSAGMNERIGTIAGKIWKLLGKCGCTALEDLKASVAEDEHLINMAIGWLARENKIVVLESRRGSQTIVSFTLTPEERQVFEHAHKTAKAPRLTASRKP
jgi:hypothetical protein